MPPAVERSHPTTNPYLICAAAWAVPGSGHLWLGRRQKGMVFLITLPLMFAFGLWLNGQLFPFDVTQPLVILMAFADLGNGLPYFVARAIGAGEGQVTAITYEYGNTFIIVAGLLNMLVVLDAFDVAGGRKVTTHAGLMIVFAVFVSIVFATLMRDEPAAQIRLGLRMFGGLVGGGLLVAWLLYPLPF